MSLSRVASPGTTTLALLALSLGACAQTSRPATAPTAPTDGTAASPCEAGKASLALGQQPLPDVVEAARLAAGAEVVRVLRHDQTITKEFRVGRLNLVLDAQGRIASANCS